jgi:hypothetical protein
LEELGGKEKYTSEDVHEIAEVLRKMIPGGGASRYHPEMFAKVFTYGYMKGTCSCRLIAAAMRENVTYMWLSGNQKPGFKTGMRVSAGGVEGRDGGGLRRGCKDAAPYMAAAKGYVKMENAVLKEPTLSMGRR